MTRRETTSWIMGLMMDWFTIIDREPSLSWVPKKINLPREVSLVKPGPIDLNVFPISSLVYEWFDDPQWREIFVVKGSQGALSQSAQNLSCYIADHQLGDIMWVLESDKKVVELNNERLKPMITKSCESLKRHLYEAEDKKLKNRILMLKGLKIIMAGARTASAVASRPIPFIFGDEVDEWPIELKGKESNAVALLRERAKLFSWAKLMFFSKPRNSVTSEQDQDHKKRNHKQEDGIIWGEYLSGTRHKCHIPCPECGHYHEIVWENVCFHHCRAEDGKSWDYERMKRETYLQCPKCQAKITDEMKVDLVINHRKWVQTNFEGDLQKDGTRINQPIPKKMSAHMSDLYSNTREFPDLRLGELAVKWCSCANTSDRRAFRRGTLGLPVENKKFDKLDTEPLLAFVGSHEQGTLPTRPAWTFLKIDVQGHGTLYRWQKIAFGKIANDAVDDTCWVFDQGETDSAEELEFQIDKPIPIADEPGAHMRCNTAWIDEGDGTTTKQVLDLCIRPKLYRRLSTVKGRGGAQTENIKDRVELQSNRTHKGKKVDRYLIDSDYFLDDLYEERFGKRKEIDEAIENHQVPPAGRLWFYANPPNEFLQEFCTEKKDWHVRKGKLVFGWLPKPTGGKNDHSDLLKYGLAAWYRIKPMIEDQLRRAKNQRERLEAAKESAKTKT
jgi:phage terminase large subunit GpA-like protein